VAQNEAEGTSVFPNWSQHFISQFYFTHSLRLRFHQAFLWGRGADQLMAAAKLSNLPRKASAKVFSAAPSSPARLLRTTNTTPGRRPRNRYPCALPFKDVGKASSEQDAVNVKMTKLKISDIFHATRKVVAKK